MFLIAGGGGCVDKILSRLLYARLHPILHKFQADDQVGFRSDNGIDDAFTVLECFYGKSIESNQPVWLARLDMRKAFD